MKRAIYIFAAILAPVFTRAQQPEPVKSFATVLMPVEWYKQQAVLWKKELDKDPNNGTAWYNYYRANRSINRLDTTDKRSGEQKQEQEKAIVDDMGKAIPNSYEYNLSRWLISGNAYESVSFLKKAAEMGEGHTEHFSDMIVWGEMERNTDRKEVYARKWYDAGTVSPGLLYYSYNVLAGLRPNAILFTSGDNDTYPVWILQSMGIRKDVTVLNLPMLYIDEYREKMFRELGVNTWQMQPAASSTNHQHIVKEAAHREKSEHFNRGIVRHVAANKKDRPVYAALTVGEAVTQEISGDLYLTGLAYEFSARPIDNMALLKKNFEQLYALDYLDKAFFKDVSEYWVKQTNYNYIVPLIKLYDHYRESGELSRAAQAKARVLNIVKGQPYEEETKNYFNRN